MKKLLFTIGCLIVGVIVSSFIIRSQGFDFSDKNIDKATLDKIAANPAIVKRILSDHNYNFDFSEHPNKKDEPIKKDEAMALIDGFRRQNNEDIALGGGLFGQAPVEGSSIQELGGFVLTKKSIDAIYKNDGTQTCTGLRIYLAKRPGSAPESRVFTVIAVGTKADGTSTTGGDIDWPIIEHVDPCPTNCGALRPPHSL